MQMPLRQPEMDRGKDSDLQHFPHGAPQQGLSEISLNRSFLDNHQATGFNYAPAPAPPTTMRRQPIRELLSYNDFDREHFDRDRFGASAPSSITQDTVSYSTFNRDHSLYEPLGPPLPLPTPSSQRLSLAPRNVYGQLNNRSIVNAKNRIKIQENLQHGTLFNAQQTSTRNSIQTYTPMAHFADEMLLSPGAREVSRQPNFLDGVDQNKFGQLQRQIMPSFDPNDVSHNSKALEDSYVSSPMHLTSSPSERASIRRDASRSRPPTQWSKQHNIGEHTKPPETPRKQIIGNPVDRPRNMINLQHAPPIAHGIQLISPQELSTDRIRSIFPYELFNAIQSKCFAPIYRTDDNIVVSAPTGSGKTVLLELAICRLIDAQKGVSRYKIVYMAPIKSLCSERARDWQKKFDHLGLSCAELTGDTGSAEMSKVKNASIIITTPEKWDSITRKWKDHGKLLELVKLFLIDEVHILNDPRGATLEAVVSRMKTIGANVRFIALSATVPNSHDIAVWLGKDHTNKHVPAHRETFGEDFRPVKLQKHVHGIDGPPNDFAFDLTLNGKLPNLIAQYTHRKPMMIFCFTKKSCEKTAGILAETWTRQAPNDRAWPAPVKHVKVGHKDLRDLVSCGVAFHHAGLDAEDRHQVESAFLDGNLSVICCTSTLAMGVNLPCHLVVLKGTSSFRSTGPEEYSDLEVMQMLGRAGRPQFDDSAVAIIMTRKDQVQRYQKMISGQDILESTLHLNLIEHLNSEIGLGTVCDMYSAKQWLAGTFLSVRMRQNPEYYKIPGTELGRDVDERLERVCDRDIKLLQNYKLVTYESRFKSTDYGEAMARYMVQFETMKLLLKVPARAKVGQILDILCQASEFKDLRMKPNERPHLRELNKSPLLKFPIKENISTTAHKISILIQVQLSGIDLPNNKEFTANIKRQFQLDKSLIFERIQRLVRCVVDCKVVDYDAIAARNALDLARALSAEFWEDSSMQLRQIPQVGPVAARKLTSNGVNSIKKLAALDSTNIERVMGKNPPFGKKIQEILVKFPRLTIVGEITDKVPSKSGQPIKVNAKVKLQTLNDRVPVWDGKAPPVTFTAETCNGTLVHFWRGPIAKLHNGWDEDFQAELSGPDDEIVCQLCCDDIVGTGHSVVLRHNIPASAFPPPKSQSQLQPELQPQAKESHGSSDPKDEFGDEDFEDGELLAAVKNVEGDVNQDEFEEIFDSEDEPCYKPSLSTRAVTDRAPIPVRLKNGRFECNHNCRGGTLKNGKPCKHKCCHEGLDKPRKLYKKSSSGTGNEPPATAKGSQVAVATKSKATEGKMAKKINNGIATQQLKLKASKYTNENEDYIEHIDLAKELSPTPYSSVGSRDYRKLHKLHSNVQKDKPIRLENKKPKFTYASGDDPLAFLDSQEDENNDRTMRASPKSPPEDFEFPSPSKLSRGNKLDTQLEHCDDDPFHMLSQPKLQGGTSKTSVEDYDDDHFSMSPQAKLHQGSKEVAPTEDYDDDPFDLRTTLYTGTAPSSSYGEHSPDELEMGMVGIDDSMALNSQRLGSPKLSTSFENSVVDFSSYNDGIETKSQDQVYEPSTVQAGSHKRARDHNTSDMAEVKCRRARHDEDVDELESEQSLPEWLDGIDPFLLGELKGIVEFVE